jgi:hypothetical protein
VQSRRPEAVGRKGRPTVATKPVPLPLSEEDLCRLIDAAYSDGRRLIEYGEKFREFVNDVYCENCHDVRPRYEVGRDAMLAWHRESIKALGGDDV